MEKPPLETSNAANILSEKLEASNQRHLDILCFRTMFLGPMDERTQNLWVYENDKMVYRSISYVPGLYKIFDEILLDAAENKHSDPKMDFLKVSIDPSTNTISVYYNGSGISVEINPETNVYLPELNYSNFNYGLKGTRTGHGAKLTNIYSTEFIIETADGRNKYKQVFTNNMFDKSVPEVTKCKEDEIWTKVTFKPDLKKFGMDSLKEEDIVGLMKKRVLDMAGFLGKTVKVELNGQLFRIIKSCDDLNMKSDEKSKPVIELAFRKKKAKDRKTWIRKLQRYTFTIDREDKLINFKSFFNKEAKLFSRADLQRSIPSLVDGLKLGQRKILFCLFKKKLCKAINVGQFIGYVSAHSAYHHHGGQSLASTIIGMAQDFVGSNNINLLKPNGQFGTRNLGGKDHASPRRISTELNPVTRCLFHEDDDQLLNYLNEDGRSIEPNWYIPIIPLVLVNGSNERIGTGWSSYIANYNPREIIANVKHWLNGENMVPMQPWYRGFNGKIEKSSKKGGYIVSGKVEVDKADEMTFKITELPIQTWTQHYKRYLQSIAEGFHCVKKKKKAKRQKTDGSTNKKCILIEDFSQNGDYANVNIDIRMKSDRKDLIMKEELLLKTFKLTTTISTSNMYLLNAEGKIKKYDNPEQILEDFLPLRLEYYEKRRENILSNLKRLLFLLYNIVKFILRDMKRKMKRHISETDLLMELKRQGFTPMPREGKSTSTGANDDNLEALKDDYEYLLYLPYKAFVIEEVQELLAEMNEKKKQFDVLKTTTAKSLWMKDLNELEKKLDEIYGKEEEKESERSSQEIYGKEEEEESERSSQAENVVKVTKPKGIAGCMQIQKDSAATDAILSLQEFQGLDAYNFKPSCEKTRALETEEPPLPDDDDFLPYRELLGAYNFIPSGEKTGALETEEPPLPAGKKQNNRKGGAKKTTVVLDTDGENEVGDVDDDGFELVQQPAPEASKKEGGRNLGTKRTFGQMLLTDMLQPAEGTGTSSPEKKVRKMRESPFNKGQRILSDI